MLNPKSDRKLQFAAGMIECQVEQLTDEQVDVNLDSQDYWSLQTRVDDLSRVYMAIMHDDVDKALNVVRGRIKWIEKCYPNDVLTPQRVNHLNYIVDVLTGADDGPDDYYGSVQ